MYWFLELALVNLNIVIQMTEKNEQEYQLHNYLVTYHLKLTLNQCGINSGLKLYRYWVQFKKT